MLVDIDSLGRVVVNRDYSGTDRIRRTSDTLAADRWYYVAWTLDNADAATGIRLYIDGVEAAYGFAQNGVGSPTDFGGAWFLSANAGSFDGRIADARVWTAELTPDEIWLEYLSTGAPVRTADLVFNPDLATLNDPISGLDGTADGTTLLLDEPVPDIAVLDDEPGDPLPGAALMPHAQHF